MKKKISYLGLEEKEVLVLQSAFQLDPSLKEDCTFSEFEISNLADLLLVNIDCPDSLESLKEIEQAHPAVKIIEVAKSPSGKARRKQVQAPLQFRKMDSLIDAIKFPEKIFAPSNDTTSAEIAGTNLSLLVVDDSALARQLIKIKLRELSAQENLSIQITSADSGEAALEHCQDNIYDLVFMDVVMPGIDGYEACERVKKINPMPVAMLTGLSSAADRVRGSESGCDYFLTKPPEDHDLLDIITHVSLSAIKKKARLTLTA